MAAITENDKMNFRTQIVDGKPQIFFDTIDNSSSKTRQKRNSRAISNINRQSEQKSKINNQKYPTQYETKRQPTKNEQSINKNRVNEDGTALGVYMTMDEIADLVNAVKENAKTDTTTTTDTKAFSPPRQRSEPTVAPVVPNLDLVLEPPPLPPSQVSPRDEALGKMADKKRQKWMREKAEIERMKLEIEYDQLKHQLSPRQKKNPSPQRSTFQYDFPPPSNKTAAPTSSSNKPLPVPALPPALKQNGYQYDMSTRTNDESNQDPYKTRLIEKKQQQWKQENSEKVAHWDPFGRPGAGAPRSNDNQSQITQPPPPSNPPVPYRPPVSQPQPYDNSSSSILPSERARVPAAMRTNLAFGNGRHQDDIETVKELERRQWLDDLHKQIEENKRQKYDQQETERRQDFLRENVQPLVQEAANRHQQPSEASTTNYTGQNSNKHNSSMHQTHSDAKSTGNTANQRTGENIFGPTYDTSSTQNASNKVDPSHLHVGIDRQNYYRPQDVRRDEAVNTVDATFRGDHGNKTDLRIPPNRRTAPYAYEDSDVPPQVPNHHDTGYRNNSKQPGKKTTRIRSLDDNPPSRRTSINDYHSNSNNADITSQMNGHSPADVQHRPLWNYNKQKRGEYVPASKRDPNYEKRQRHKQLALGNFDYVDDVQKKTCYNRWNSDSEIQQQRQQPTQMNRTRTTIPKTTTYGNRKDESILNLLKGQNKQQQQQQQQQGYITRYPPSNHTRTNDEYVTNHPSSLDRYENNVPYSRSDEENDPTAGYSQPIETTSHQQLSETNANYQPQEWNNTNRQYPVVQPTQYSVPVTKQEHILQQLSSIKENLIRRQRELASPVNAIPV